MKRLTRIAAVLLAAGFSLSIAAASENTIVGDEFEYTVRRGDSLTGIGARFAVSVESLAAQNGLPLGKRIRPGQVLQIENRHIVPRSLENGILINLPQRLLFFFEDGRLEAWYPIAAGQPGSWQTPTGSYKIVTREENPTWDVPKSIQQEMRRNGERVRTKVPPGPDNPLGRYWMGLSMTCCGIHGTNAPQSIYRFQTHGCIRMQPQDAADLFERIEVGTPVEIIYEPVLLARDGDGRIFLEVHPDVYERTDGSIGAAAALAETRELREARRSPRWQETLEEEHGVAVRLPILYGRDEASEPEFRVGRSGAESTRRLRERTGILLSNVGPRGVEVRRRHGRSESRAARLPAAPAVTIRR